LGEIATSLSEMKNSKRQESQIFPKAVTASLSQAVTLQTFLVQQLHPTAHKSARR